MFIIGQTAYFTQEIGDYIIVVIIGLIIMLFFSLVFNEIIELNFCGLSSNTKRNLALRAKKDFYESELMKNETVEIDEESIEEYIIELDPNLNIDEESNGLIS